MRRGFTLFEVILVLAILVTLAALSYPTIESMHGYYKVEAAADLLRGGWAEARTRAMEEGRPYRCSVVLEKGNFRIAPDSSDYWTEADAPAAKSDNPPLVVSNALPKGIRFHMADAARGEADANTVLESDSITPSQWSTLVVFLPDGTAREDVSVVLELAGVRPYVVKLRALTGSVTVRPLDQGQRR